MPIGLDQDSIAEKVHAAVSQVFNTSIHRRHVNDAVILATIINVGGKSLEKNAMADIADFQAVNKIYAQYFKEPYPARSAFQVAALPLGADVEVEAIFRLQ